MTRRNVFWFLPALALGTWAITFFHILLSGQIKTLLHPLFRPVVEGGAVVLLILAFWHVFFFRPLPTAPKSGSSVLHLLRWLVLIVPIVAAASLAPASFSAMAVRMRSVSTTANLPAANLSRSALSALDTALAAPPGKPIQLDVNDVLAASTNTQLRDRLDGRDVRILGQFTGTGGSSFTVTRFIMYCCAADATPLSLRVVGANPLEKELKPMEWIEAEGKLNFVTELGVKRAEIDLTSLRRAAAPGEPFLN